jgi:hypothetical protein
MAFVTPFLILLTNPSNRILCRKSEVSAAAQHLPSSHPPSFQLTPAANTPHRNVGQPRRYH